RGFWQFAVQRSEADFFHISDFGTDIRLRSWISSNQHGAKTGSHTPFVELRDPFCEVFFYMCRSSAAVKFERSHLVETFFVYRYRLTSGAHVRALQSV